MKNLDGDFEQAFVDNYERLVNSLTAIVGDRELARDSVQEAFVKASTRWRKIRGYDDPMAWVRRVAINRSRDHLRATERRRRRERKVIDQNPTLDPVDSDMVDAAIRLHDLLARLPPQQRAAATLYYLEELSVDDIATTLGITGGAVKYHLNQARATLRIVVERDRRLHE
ncbi:MAG: sigma-70 family RNA polymerase sigma factor [Acidimicrobiia bacterium]|nr:sigma-70 family RNA polymerase sigma factor [Acidimicrobiia bacterium]